MKIKKTWFSYILWALFTIILFASVGVSAIGMNQKTDILEYLPSIGMFYGVFVLGIGIYIGIAILYHKVIKEKLEDSSLPEIKPLEIIGYIIILMASVFVRAICIISNFDSIRGTDIFFNYSAGLDNSFILSQHTNGEILYVSLLKIVFDFLGSKPFAAMALQTLLQLISLALIYPLLKRSLGKIAAWIGFLMFAFLPGSFMQITHVTADCMLVCFVLLFLFFLSLCNSLNENNKIFTPLQGIPFFLLGLAGGLVAYMDIIGVGLIIITAFSFFTIRSDDRDMLVKKPIIQFLLFMVGFACALALSLFFFSAFFRGGITESFLYFAMQFVPENGLNMTLLNPHYGSYDVLALYALCGIWFVAFLRSTLDRGFPYVFFIVLSTAYVFLGLKTGDYSAVSSVAWILCSAVGFTSLSAFGEAEAQFEEKKTPRREAPPRNVTELSPSEPRPSMFKQPTTQKESIFKPSTPPPAPTVSSSVSQSAPVPPVSTPVRQSAPVPPAPTPVSRSAPVPPTSTPSRTVPSVPVATVPRPEVPIMSGTAEPSPSKPQEAPAPAKPVRRMIKNPLPEPKPHVPKEMNYDYIPTAAEMRYDITDMRGKEYYDV